MTTAAEQRRLAEHRAGTADWKRWGAYLSERQWGTVREDYSRHGEAWDYFPDDHARSGSLGAPPAPDALCSQHLVLGRPRRRRATIGPAGRGRLGGNPGRAGRPRTLSPGLRRPAGPALLRERVESPASLRCTES